MIKMSRRSSSLFHDYMHEGRRAREASDYVLSFLFTLNAATNVLAGKMLDYNNEFLAKYGEASTTSEYVATALYAFAAFHTAAAVIQAGSGLLARSQRIKDETLVDVIQPLS